MSRNQAKTRVVVVKSHSFPQSSPGQENSINDNYCLSPICLSQNHILDKCLQGSIVPMSSNTVGIHVAFVITIVHPQKKHVSHDPCQNKMKYAKDLFFHVVG